MKKDHRLQKIFIKLTKDIKIILDKNMGEVRTKDILDSIQKEQVERLMSLEEEFRELIIKKCPTRTKEAYQKFMAHILVENQNILTARPFFREKAKDFSKNITPALKSNNYTELQKYHINFNFIRFLKNNWKGSLPKKCTEIYNKIETCRTELIENNLPLVINRARIFYESTPNNDVTLMDLINSATIGLISGIDKYKAEEFSKVFRSVCIGRMSGNMVDLYSETTLHFYPSDKKVLYKANIFRHRKNITDDEELWRAVNEDFAFEAEEKGKKYNEISLGDFKQLLSAQSTISADASDDEDENATNVFYYTKDDKVNIESTIIRQDSLYKVGLAIKDLTIIEKKILKLKGVSL